jgi:hypothetical protein
MVENEADDGVEPKPAKIEAFGIGVGSSVASGDVKPTVNVKLKVKTPFQAHIGHIEEKPKAVPTGHIEEKPKSVRTGVRGIELDTNSFFTINERWRERQGLLGWVHRQAAKAGFTISIDKSCLKRPYLTMQCERSGEYKPPKTRKKLNLEGMGSRIHKIGGLQCFVEFTTMSWRQS